MHSAVTKCSFILFQFDLNAVLLDSTTVYIFLAVVYSGILTSFLTLPAFEKPIDSLSDLYVASQERGYLLGLLADSSQEYLFKFAESGIYADLWRTVTKKNYERNLDESLKRMMNREPFTYTGDDVTLIMGSAVYGLSKFHIAKETFYPQPFGIALRSGSPYKETFSRVLMRLQESGMINKWIKDVLENAATSQAAGSTSDSSEDELPRLSLLHLQSALILYGGGVVLALLVFVGEVVAKACQGEESQSED
ncbi:glutamate receptor ionotropic, delta-2-like [Oratosquilla oratoria]|uniref:glutamate receptor ionotropic, delta-2-like n=1 Tax=Oratosquilla oratoria TaxID=337810 RepID=UPI003F75825D